MVEEQLKREVIRIAKDQERIRIAYEIIDSMESMIFYRGGDHSPRIQILRLLQDMSSRASTEIERVDKYGDDED